MANNRGVRWFCLWWAFSVCVLCSSVAEAAKRVTPQMNTGSQSTGGPVSRNSGSLVTTNGLRHGQYIKFEPGGRKMHIPVTQGTYFSIHGITINAQNMFRRNLPAIAMGAAIAGIGYGLDWIFDEEKQQWVKEEMECPDGEVCRPLDGQYHPSVMCSRKSYALTELGQSAIITSDSGFTLDGESYSAGTLVKVSVNYGSGESGFLNNCVNKYPSGNWPPKNGYYPVLTGEIVDPNSLPELVNKPITEADIAQIAPEINSADPGFIQEILRNACNGSNAPESCFESLVEKTQLNGPASVTTPSSTSTTTTTGPDGVAGTTTTTTNTTFNITYGPNHYTYNTTKNTTTTKPDGTTDTTTETDAPALGEEAPEPEEVELDVAQPCAGDNCAGPAYTDLYTPSEATKEGVLDEYIARATQIPLFQAVTGFFDVSVSASCPVWSAEIDFSVMGIGFDHSLLFDYHCQPWFTDYRPFAMAVFLVVGAFLAFRIAVL